MGHLLTAYGEEYIFTNNANGVTFTIGLYDDASTGTTGDAISDGSDMGAITTEPSNTNYAAATDTYSVENPTGSDVVMNNDTQLSYDFSDQSTSQTVDSYYVSVSFTSTIVGAESTASEHLIFTGALSQSRDIGSIDTLNIDAGSVELQIE